MRTGGETDMTKLIVAFRNFVKTPKTKFVTVIGYLQLVTCVCLRTMRSFPLGSNFEVQ